MHVQRRDVILNGILFAILMVLLVVGSIGWHLRRHKRPLNARIYFFVIYFNAINLIESIKNILSILVFSFQVGGLLDIAFMPFYFNLMLCAAFRVYFLFNITETKVKVHKEEENQKDSSKVDIDSTFSGSDNWFFKNMKYIRDQFLIRALLGISILESGILLAIIGPFSEQDIAIDVGWTIPVYIYAIFFTFVSWKLRFVKDGFNLRNEFLGFGIIWFFSILLILIFSFEPSGIVRNSINIRFLEFVGFIGAYLVVIIWPLIKSFKKLAPESDIDLIQSNPQKNL